MTDYTIANEYTLPSGGLVYNKEINPQFKLRSMTTAEEMKRLNHTDRPYRAMAEIIDDCLVEDIGISGYDLCIADYQYMLHKLRIVTYGEEYKISVRCPYCGDEIDTTAHLDELAVKEFDIDKFEEKRTITLPRSGSVVTLKFQTPRMLDEIENRTKEMKRKYKTADIAFDLLVLLECVIDTVDGAHLEASKVETFINNLPAMDMAKIVNSIDELNAMVGIENKLTVDCPKCGGEVRTSFRYGTEFFRPTNI